MEAVAALITAVALLALGLAAWAAAPWRPLLRRRVVLVLRTEVTVEGILWRRAGPLLVLRDVTVHLDPAAKGTPVDGEFVVERDKIEWMQAVPK